MNINDECQLSFYEPIADIDKNNRNRILIVKHCITEKIYIKKRLVDFDIEIYKYLQKNPHPNIPKIEFVLEENKELILIEEYINNPNLEVVLEKKCFFDKKEAIYIVNGICNALEMLHSVNPPIIHRDIKLSNIIVTDDGVVKLIDYNASRFYKPYLDKDTVHLGTLGYASPEHFGFTQTDSRSDIYSLGILLNILLTGTYPKEKLPPEGLGKVVKKATEMDPEKRYETIEKFRKEINALNDRDQNPGSKKKFHLPIPGFRSGKLWKMMIAIIMYVIVFRVSYVSFGDIYETLWRNSLSRLAALTMFLTLIAFYTNYFNLRERLPFTSHEKKWVRVLAYGGYTLIIPLLSSLIVAIA